MKRRLLLAVAAGALAIFGAEALLAGPLRPELHDLRDDAWQERLRAMHATLYQADPELVYVPRPGAAVRMDYGLAAFDERGLRVSERGASPTAEQRVIVLGDSLVWGELLPAEDSLPAALGDALGPTAEVLNLGVSGYDTTQEAGWYLRAGRPLHPDAVVLVYCLNDMLIQSGPHELYATAEGQRALAAERRWLDAQAPLRNETVNRLWWQERGGDGAQLLAALRHIGRWHRLHTLPGGYVDDYLLAARDPARVARARGSLALLGAAIRQDGARPILVLSPALYWWHRYQWDEVHDAVRAAGQAAGFQVVEPLERWRGGDPEPLRFPGDNLHYTAEGNRRLARIIAQELGPASTAPTSAPGP